MRQTWMFANRLKEWQAGPWLSGSKGHGTSGRAAIGGRGKLLHVVTEDNLGNGRAISDAKFAQPVCNVLEASRHTLTE